MKPLLKSTSVTEGYSEDGTLTYLSGKLSEKGHIVIGKNRELSEETRRKLSENMKKINAEYSHK